MCKCCIEPNPVDTTAADGTRVKTWITDGFGRYWPAYCPECGAAMAVVRPGDARCSAECWLQEKEAP